MEEEPNQLGSKVAGRIARTVADATVDTRRRLAGHTAGVAQKVLGDFTNHVSDEVREVMGPLWRQMANDPEVPAEIKPLLHSLGNLRGQAWAWIGGTASGAALGAGLMDLFNNLLAPVIQPMIAADPNAVLSPDTAASALVRGFDWTNERHNLEYDAQVGGIDRKRLNVLKELNTARLTHQEIQELINRGQLSHTDGILELRRSGYPDLMGARIVELREARIGGEVLASMANRDIISVSDGERMAKEAGMRASDFRNFLELYGEPLGPESLAHAFRRGIISEDRYNRGIVQGPIRKEWFDVLRELAFSRMSTVDAADSVNQGHMSLAEGQKIAHENGLVPEDFATLIASAGQPPGIAFAEEAYNRGLISDDYYVKMFRESRIKNEYIALMQAMRTRLIPQETARLLYRNGVYTENQALNTLLSHGFSPEDASALLALEHTRTDDTTRELTRSQVVEMYGERLITEADTISILSGMGYSSDDAQSMVELANLKRLRSFINSAVSKVRSAYTTGRMGEVEASATLDQLGIPNEQRDDMLTLWDIERTTISKTLTAAQVRQAYVKDLITEPDAMARLTAQGYDQIDAGLFLQLTS